IQVFPQLKYPSLETCPDYNEALRYKFHLSYILGEVLIKAYQNWYKGAGFKLKNNIKKANKEFQIFREILKEFKELNGKTLMAIKDNKQLFLKEFPRIKNILKTHQNYQPIMNNIFHNFNYFMQNFDLIEEWLLSDDFKEKYKKENHPYPSLLDPKKLNDENEKINYHNIPAELAWEMNLPLPDRYEFMWFFSCCSGSNAMYRFFKYCNIAADAHPALTGKIMYKDMYYYINNTTCSIAVIPPFMYDFYHDCEHMNNKLLYLYSKVSDIIFIARDPISILKTALNHINNPKIWEQIDYEMKNVHMNNVANFRFPILYYSYSIGRPNVKDLYKILDAKEFYFTIDKRINFLKNITNNIRCINFSQISYDKAYDTFLNLSSSYNFLVPKDPSIFQNRVDSDDGSLVVLPVRLYFVYQNKEITFLITTKQLIILDPDREKYTDVTKKIINWEIKYSNIIILLDLDKWNIIKKDSSFLEYQQKIQEYLKALEDNEQKRIQNAITEIEILNYLKENKDIARKFKQILDNDHLPYIKQHRPDIVASWKYYQEFEKMCEELDENN
ncbi:DUF2972 domain-containing protein, partial [Campylobacter jejuni]|nr:DUF2972 domain-containing protein [Campylobacter jejuni]EAH8355658.1 DUF2972 domain-containing protein [Campylobacter jejuni]EAI0033759.1 DUF2972 domain-containing protein [Campylobacter jejuni]EAI4066173.1 DUF2972 domain-containing protein [Campylobacter jejuni]EAI4507025.1 DUF2972 domain-containing protein [Campylobacter jejuni]